MPDWRGRNISCLLYLRHDLHVNPLLCVSPFAQNKVTSRSSVARRAEAIKTRGRVNAITHFQVSRQENLFITLASLDHTRTQSTKPLLALSFFSAFLDTEKSYYVYA